MATTEALERWVADFQERRLPEPTRRDAALPALSGKADAVVGMRRSGKSWLLFQEIRAQEAAGVPRSRMLHVNFEDDRLQPLVASDLDRLLDAQYRRFPEERGRGVQLFLDEVQNVPSWERFVRRALEVEGARVVVTGSSAKLLSREIATSLRGRSLATELLPFGFRESLRHRGAEPSGRWPPAARVRSALERAFLDYMDCGGFPEVQGAAPDLRIRVLQDYVHVVLLRDVVERHRVTNVDALRRLVRHLLATPGGKFSVHRSHRDLRAAGVSVGKDTLHEYLGHLADAFLLFAVEIDSDSAHVRAVNPRKCYPVDVGLSRATSFRASADVGRMLETLVYLELRRRGLHASYVVTESGREVDFLVRREGGGAELVQACADLSDAETRARELGALDEALRSGRAKSATVVTLHDEETVLVAGRRVRVVPAWRWFLEDAAFRKGRSE